MKHIFLCIIVVFIAHASAQRLNATCLTGSTPYPFGVPSCPLGFYCPFTPLPPTFCTPTLNCSIVRLGSVICDPQGSTEPTVCRRGTYCETPATQSICPKGYFCPTGTYKPKECPPLSLCGEGSFRALYLGSIITCAIIDGLLIIGWLLIKFYPSLSQRFFRTRTQGTPMRTPVEMVSKISLHQTISVGEVTPGGPVVSQGLVDGFKRARANQEVSLGFEFENLSITLKNGLNILQGVSGSIRPGRVTAIMGPSGAGKTTFMNCLMGKVPRTGGSLRINRKDLEIHTLRKVIGYVPQDDVMLAELTVKENIRHSAKIRLPRDWSSTETENFVTSVLEALDLSHVAHTVVGDHTRRGISGGQKKRTNIAIELAAAPLAIFLDEPTSGLDSTAALKVAEILRDMAQLGITVVAVIHQPRHEIFELFDDILMIAPGGITAYLGPQANVVDHFRQMGFVFDPYINQADQLMDMLSGKGTKEDGRSYSVQDIVNFWAESEAQKSHREAAQASESDSKSLATIRHLGKQRGGNFFVQALLCHNRSLIQQFRLIPALVLEIGVALLAGALMGLATGAGGTELYKGVLIAPFTILSAAPVEWAVPLYSLLFGMAIGLAGGPAGVKTFGEERQVFFREAAAGHGKFAYYIGKSVSVLYRQILSALHFAMIYHILAKPLTPFAAVFVVVLLFFFCVYGLAAVVSMLVRRENASLLGVVVCLFAAVFNGFGPSLKSAHKWGLSWLWDMSYARWLSEAMYTEEVLPYEHIYEVHTVSEPQFGFTLGRFAMDCGLAVVIGIVLRAVAFGLMLVTKRKQQK